MLVLKRKIGESLLIGEARVKLLGWRDGGLRIGIEAPKEMQVLRPEAKNAAPPRNRSTDA